MIDLRPLVASAEAGTRKGTPRRRDMSAGQVAGLTEPGEQARLRPLAGETPFRHGSYLFGRLMVWFATRVSALDEQQMLTAGCYAAALADEAGQRYLGDLGTLYNAHTYATLRVEKKLGTPMGERDERMLVGWLMEQYPARPSADFPALFERRRAARLAKLFPSADPPAPGPG